MGLINARQTVILKIGLESSAAIEFSLEASYLASADKYKREHIDKNWQKAMKIIKRTLVLFFSLLSFTIYGQINKPTLSPRITSEQQVGMVNVKLDYGQPNKQSRKIFGGLIPFNKIWRTGANSSTKISFDREVRLANNNIPKGIYGLYTIPDTNEWTVIIHKNSNLWGTGGYDESNDFVRFQVPVKNLQDTVETLGIYFENFHTNGADLVIAWENVKIAVPLFVDSDAIIFKEIDSKIHKSNEEINAQTYFDAARFYYLKKRDLNTAMIWFDKAIELSPNAFWFVYYKAELAFHLKDYEMAEKSAEKCLAEAKKNPSTDYGYIAKCELLLNMIFELKNESDSKN